MSGHFWWSFLSSEWSFFRGHPLFCGFESSTGNMGGFDILIIFYGIYVVLTEYLTSSSLVELNCLACFKASFSAEWLDTTFSSITWYLAIFDTFALTFIYVFFTYTTKSIF